VQWQADKPHQGEVLALPTLWSLSQAWYHDRLSPTYRSRTVAQVEAIFESLGLTSDFWRLGYAADIPQK